MLGAFIIVLAFVAAATAAGTWWLTATEPGLRALLATVQRVGAGVVTAEGVRGTLIGAPRIDALRVQTPGLDAHVEGLALDWTWRDLLERRLSIAALTLARVRITTTPSDEPATLPKDLRLPGALRVERLAIGELRVGPPDAPLVLRDLTARIDSDGATLHRIDALRVTTPWGALSGAVDLGARAPFALRANAVLDGRIEVGTPPSERPLRLQATADGSLERLVVDARTTGAIDGTVRATLRPFAPIPVERADLRLRGIDPAAWGEGLPHAMLSVDARLAPAVVEGAAAAPTDWRDWVVTGPIELVNAAPGRIDETKVPVRRLTGQARWQAQRLSLDDLRIELGAGRDPAGVLSGRVHWTPQPSGGRVETALRAADVDAAALHGALKATRLSGRLQATADASSQSMQAALVDPRFTVDVEVSQSDRRVVLRRARLGARAAIFEANGSIGLDGARAFELDGRLADFDPSLYAATPPARLSATLSARGTLPPGGPVAARVRFALDDGSRLDGRPLAGRGRFELVDQRIADADVDLDLAGNRLLLQGAFGRPDDAIDLRIDAPRLADLGFGLGGAVRAEGRVRGGLQSPAGRLTANATQLSLPGGPRIAHLQVDAVLERGLDGPLSATVKLGELRTGVEGAPLVGQAEAALRGTLREHTLEANAQATAAGDLVLRMQGGVARIGRAPAATRPASSGPAASETVGLIGALLDGTARWRGTIGRLELAGSENVRLVEPVALTAGRHAARLERAVLATDRGRVTIDEVDWTPRALVTRGTFDDAPLPPEALGAAEGVRSSLRLAGQWDLRIAESIVGMVRIARQQGDLVLSGVGPGDASSKGELPLGLSVLQIDLDANGERLAATARVQGTRVGTFDARGTLRLPHGRTDWRAARDGALEVGAQLSVPSLDWVGPAVDPGLRTAGSLAARLQVRGSVRAPRVDGTVDADGVRIQLLEQGVDLAGGRVRLTIDESLLTLREAVFTTPVRQRPGDARVAAALSGLPATGSVRAEGTIRIAGEGVGQGLIQVRADHLAALQTTDRWLMVSGHAALRLEARRMLLEGRLRADAGAIQITGDDRPTLGSDVVVIRRTVPRSGNPREARATAASGSAGAGTGRPEPPRSAPAATPLAIDLAIDLGERFFVQGRGLNARLAGTVQVSGRVGGTLLATGSVRTVDGTFEAYNQKLAIDRGLVNFQGPIENPGLNVRAVRRGLAVEAGVEITGTVQRPVVKLVSEPNVPDSEKLSWLVLGYPPNQLSGREQELLGSAALALLSGQGGGKGSQILSSLGLDVGVRRGASSAPGSATLAQLAAASPGAGTPATADRFVTVGRRLSDKAYLSIEQSLTGTLTIVQITYQLSRRLSAVARTGAENALDLIYAFSFR